MNKNSPGVWLKVASYLLFVLSIVSLLLVLERAATALWQNYKFFGYETAGVVTLSMRTGGSFIVVSVLLIGACLLVKTLSDTRKALECARLSKWALLTLCTSVVIYSALALSPLNAWRP